MMMDMSCISSVSVPISWLWFCIAILQVVTIEEAGQGSVNLSVLFLTIAHESTLTSKFFLKVFLKANAFFFFFKKKKLPVSLLFI